MTAKIYMFRPKNVDHLKFPKGNDDYNYLRELYKAISGGYDREAWEILRRKR